MLWLIQSGYPSASHDLLFRNRVLFQDEANQRPMLSQLDFGQGGPISFHYDEGPQNSFSAPIG